MIIYNVGSDYLFVKHRVQITASCWLGFLFYFLTNYKLSVFSLFFGFNFTKLKHVVKYLVNKLQGGAATVSFLFWF